MKPREEAFIDAVARAATFAFQPIVDSRSGACVGFEALLRNIDRLGFPEIPDLFDHAWVNGVLHRVDLTLRRIAISQFARVEACASAMLFYNFDGRCFDSPDYEPTRTQEILDRYGLSPERLVLELSERYGAGPPRFLDKTLTLCRRQGYRLAIEDFGRGAAEMQILCDHEPDFIKMDRFFIQGLAEDKKKQHIAAAVARLAQGLGVAVIAQGVETEQDLLACRAAGIDLVQGFRIARPTTQTDTLRRRYPIARAAEAADTALPSA